MGFLRPFLSKLLQDKGEEYHFIWETFFKTLNKAIISLPFLHPPSTKPINVASKSVTMNNLTVLRQTTCWFRDLEVVKFSSFVMCLPGCVGWLTVSQFVIGSQLLIETYPALIQGYLGPHIKTKFTLKFQLFSQISRLHKTLHIYLLTYANILVEATLQSWFLCYWQNISLSSNLILRTSLYHPKDRISHNPWMPLNPCMEGMTFY